MEKLKNRKTDKSRTAKSDVKMTSAQMLSDAKDLLGAGRLTDSLMQARESISKFERIGEVRRNQLIQHGVEVTEGLLKRGDEMKNFLGALRKERLGRKYDFKTANETDVRRLVLEFLFGSETPNQRRTIGRYTQAVTVLMDLGVPSHLVAKAIKANGNIDGLVKQWQEKYGAAKVSKQEPTKLSIVLGKKRFKLDDQALKAGVLGERALGCIMIKYRKKSGGYVVVKKPTIKAL
jgi:hypothetical protein